MIDDDERRDAIRYAIVRRMNVDEFKHLYVAAQTRGARFDDLIEDQTPKFLGRTFEQEFERRKSLDIAEATL